MYQIAQVPCLHCRRIVKVPKGGVIAAKRAGRPYVVYCSRKCNLVHVAEQGAKQQEEAYRVT